MSDASSADLAFAALSEFDPSSCSGDEQAITDTIRLAAQFVAALDRPQRGELERRASVLGDQVAEGTSFDRAFEVVKVALRRVLECVRCEDGSLPGAIAWERQRRCLVGVIEITQGKALLRATDGEEYEISFTQTKPREQRRHGQPLLVGRDVVGSEVSTRSITVLLERGLVASHDIRRELHTADRVVKALAPALHEQGLVESWQREIESVGRLAAIELSDESSLLLRCYEGLANSLNQDSADPHQLEQLIEELRPGFDAKLSDIKRAPGTVPFERRIFSPWPTGAVKRASQRAMAGHTPAIANQRV